MSQSASRFGIFGNYVKIIVRSFFKNGAYTLLNLVGLSIAFAAFIYTAIYVHFETNFENFHHKAERIYRATYHFTSGDSYEVHWARIPFDFINSLPEDVPGVKRLIRFQNHERKYVRVGENKFRPENVYVTDKDVFDVFDFTLIAGNPATALSQPHAIVITQSLAKQYFGEEDPLNKEIFVIGDLDNTETRHLVTGVMADLPSHTHLPVDMLISFPDPAARTGWAYSYILLEEGATIRQVEAGIPEFIRKYNSEEDSKQISIVFQPLTDIHLHSDLAREIVPNGNIFYVKIAAGAGIFILIIALINFINLNSAMALGRAKEIGLRKVMGSSQRQLTAYLLTESIMSNVVAMATGAGLVYLTFPLFNDFITADFLFDAWLFAGGMIGLAIVCGLVAGLYPMILLTSFKPLDVVGGSKTMRFVKTPRTFSIKRVMLTLQFSVSIILMGSAWIAYSQFRYLNEKNLGMERDKIIAIPGVPDPVKSRFTAFKDHVRTLPGITGVSACMEVPSREIRDAGPVLVEGVNDDPAQAPTMDIQIIDHDFIGLMGIELLAGENIPRMPGAGNVPEDMEDFDLLGYLANERRAYLINETAMRQLGWQSAAEAIGQKINWSIGTIALASGPITGVVKDFHQETLKNKVDPLVMVYEPIWIRTFLIKVETARIQESIAEIRAAWDTMFPLYPMEYYFLDDLYENLYKGERTQLQLLYVFSGLAIAIAFIGLTGLIAYALKTRVREIAIRKVLGATLADLIRLISREYLVILLIGACLAIPVSVYGVKKWLSGFAYRVEISPAGYALTVALVGTLLILTIALQTLRSARRNPAETLKEE